MTYRVYINDEPVIKAFQSGYTPLSKDFDNIDQATLFAAEMVGFDFHIALISIFEEQ